MKTALRLALLIMIFFTIETEAVTFQMPHPSLAKGTIFETIKRRLPKKYERSANVIATAIIAEATRYKLDPFIITAVIAGESSFNPEVVGPVGEIGLMQIRPSTAQWISRRLKIPYRGKKSLENPIINIRLGTAYLSYLHQRFHKHGDQVYLAAYNMGEGSVLRFLAKKIRPSIYHRHVMKRYLGKI